MDSTDSSLLETESQDVYRNLLLQAQDAGFQGFDPPKTELFQAVIPKPGFCLKTKSDNGEKVFINVCRSDDIPAPKDISDQELLDLLESDDAGGFRIPMSLGEPHAELDKSGTGCTAYEVLVNSGFFERIKTSHIMQGFFITVVLEGFEHKYNINLDRGWKILKNRKFVGSLPEQNVRKKSKPLIVDMGNSDGNISEKARKPLVSEISSSSKTQEPAKPKAPEPPFTILQEPPDGHAEFLVAEIHLPKVKTAASLMLDIGEDRILLQTRSNVYHLDVFLPYLLLQEECGAQFNRKTKILTITMMVKPAS